MCWVLTIVSKIGNNVYIATGSKLIGGVNIGDNVCIGANSVVLSDIPSNSLAVGSPARIVKENIDISEYMDI